VLVTAGRSRVCQLVEFVTAGSVWACTGAQTWRRAAAPGRPRHQRRGEAQAAPGDQPPRQQVLALGVAHAGLCFPAVASCRCCRDNGTPLDEVARLVGHSSTAVTELVYRQQTRPVLQSGAVVMDRIFGEQPDG
jgi:hypothetical protein